MPIKLASWSSNRGLDLHILKGQSGPDLSASHLAFQLPDDSIVWAIQYLVDPSQPADVDLEFVPQFNSTPTDNGYRGAGVQVFNTTGIVMVEDPLPPLHLHNFILEAHVTNKADGTQYVLPIRFHIHESVTKFWLTPATLTIKPFHLGGHDETNYRFSVRAQFDDDTVADLTENHGVTWEPASNVYSENGRIFLEATNPPGSTITVTATLPASLGGASASGKLKIDQPWPDQATASIVVGGGWPGTINPAVVPNFLFLCDGFASADADTFKQLSASIVHRFKTNHLTTPFDYLATSINFWQTFVPSTQRGISILNEVFTVTQEGELRAYMVPNAKKPADGATWNIENLVYAAGLPVPADHISKTNRTNLDIRGDWGALYSPDPSPQVSEDLLNLWRKLGNHSLIEEIDSTLGMAYGRPPQVNAESDNKLVDFHPSRMTRQRLDPFLATIHGDQNLDLTTLWAQQGGVRPSNYDYVFIFSLCKWDRAQNADGYITFNVEDKDFLRGVSSLQDRKAYQWNPPKIPNSISSVRCGRALHEIAHSYGLGDEYADKPTPFTGAEPDLIQFSNLQTEADTRVNNLIDGDQIKWNWFRARKGALITSTVTSAGGNRWAVHLVAGQGLQFAVGDKVVLRKRQYPNPIRKSPVETISKAADGQITVLEIVDPRSADQVTVQGAINPDLTFGEGDELYMPTPAPDSVRSPTYPFAGMIAKNIKDFITSNHKPLTPVPCDPVEVKQETQDPNLDGVSLPICFSHKPKIIGLYHGGRLVSCGIFHPSGTCMMHGSEYDNLEFCAVCRYILVDIIDPFKHFQVDQMYAKFYPQK